MADEQNIRNNEDKLIDPQKLKELLELAKALKEAGALDEKLDADALDSVAGGTVGELNDLESALADVWWNSSGFEKAAGSATTHFPGVNMGYANDIADYLHDIGIMAQIDLGWAGTGIASKPNVYVNRKTGQEMTHAEVVQFIREHKSYGGLD